MYCGVIDDYKLDIDSLYEIIKRLDRFQFIFIGPVRVKYKQVIWDKISEANNVEVLGAKPYKVLPDYLESANILLLPYDLNEHTKFVFPIKLFEYMATGKCIVAKDLPSYKKYSKYFKIYSEVGEAVKYIQNYDSDPFSEERIILAKENDWHSRLRKILKLIKK